MKLSILELFFVALLTVFGIAPAVAAQPVQPLIADRIVAVVNDEAITLNELNSRMATVERQLRAQGTQAPSRSVLEKQLLERMWLTVSSFSSQRKVQPTSTTRNSMPICDALPIRTS